MRKYLIAVLLCSLVNLPGAYADDLRGAITAPAAPVYLMKEGHLPRDHWYSLKPGKHFWQYKLQDGGEEIVYAKLDDVPDTRSLSERNLFVRIATNTGSWLIPWMVAGGVTLLGVNR